MISWRACAYVASSSHCQNCDKSISTSWYEKTNVDVLLVLNSKANQSVPGYRAFLNWPITDSLLVLTWRIRRILQICSHSPLQGKCRRFCYLTLVLPAACPSFLRTCQQNTHILNLMIIILPWCETINKKNKEKNYEVVYKLWSTQKAAFTAVTAEQLPVDTPSLDMVCKYLLCKHR